MKKPGQFEKMPRKPSWILIVREPTTLHEKRTLTESPRVSTSEDAFKLLEPRLAREMVEVMYVIGLDGQNNVVHMAEVARGGLHGCSVSARDILRIAIATGSSAIILAHNHPSGDPTPSVEDIEMTRRVVEAGDIVGISVVDHIVVCPGKHRSMLNLGLIA